MLLGRGKRRAYTLEEFGRLVAATSPGFRDHLLCLAGTGLGAGEPLGLHAARVDLAAKRLEVVSVRYDAGRFDRGYKHRPKSRASIRAAPLAPQVSEVIARRLAAASGPRALVFTGPGGGNGVAAGTRTALSRYNLRRAYRDAVARIGNPAAGLPPTARRVVEALRQLDPAPSLEQIGDWLAANGRRLRPATVAAGLDPLERAGLAAKLDGGDGAHWSAAEPPRGTELDGLELHGPHDLSLDPPMLEFLVGWSACGAGLKRVAGVLEAGSGRRGGRLEAIGGRKLLAGRSRAG